jgi:hypothetical protein
VTVAKSTILKRTTFRKPNEKGSRREPIDDHYGRGMPTEMRRVVNAFRPNSEIDDPDLFSGRESQVLDLAQSLMSDGSCPMILGDRGLGKSSLAKQARLISMGDRSLLDRYDASHSAIPVDEGFIALYCGCTDAVQTTSDLLRRLTDGVTAAVAVGSDSRFELVDRTSRTKLSLKIFSQERERRWQPNTWTPRRMDDVADYEQALIDATTRLADIFESRVLLVIDELDRVQDKDGLASFIKIGTSATLKFMLVGIAQSVSELLHDHQSLERVLAPTHVAPMERPELIAIIDQAMSKLAADGVDMEFDEEATAAVARLSAGFPWFVHVLGQAALVNAYRRGGSVVTARHVVMAVNEFRTNRFAQQFSDMYQRVVRESINREIAIRVFAKWPQRDIPTSEIYPVLRSFGVSNPSVYLGQLCGEATGHVLTRVPFRQSGLVRFRNEMFKVYVRISPSIYADVKERVDRAWEQWSAR